MMSGYGTKALFHSARLTKFLRRLRCSCPTPSNNSAFPISPITVAQHTLVEFSSRQAGKFGFPPSEQDAPRTKVMIKGWLDKFFPSPLGA
jgi:hypothetical protein